CSAFGFLQKALRGAELRQPHCPCATKLGVPYYQAWIGRIMWNNPIVKSLPQSFLQLVAQWKWGAKMVRFIRWLKALLWIAVIYLEELECTSEHLRPIAPCPLISDSHSHRHVGSRLRGVLFVIGSDDLHVPPWHILYRVNYSLRGNYTCVPRESPRQPAGRKKRVYYHGGANVAAQSANPMQAALQVNRYGQYMCMLPGDLAAHTGDSTNVCQLPSACRGIGVYSSSLLILGLTRFPVAPGPANRARHGTRQKRSPTRLRLGHQ
ncbi:hypothetical protein KUCAC02_009506, partial [Chaenocephalus aceratus]